MHDTTCITTGIIVHRPYCFLYDLFGCSLHKCTGPSQELYGQSTATNQRHTPPGTYTQRPQRYTPTLTHVPVQLSTNYVQSKGWNKILLCIICRSAQKSGRAALCRAMQVQVLLIIQSVQQNVPSSSTCTRWALIFMLLLPVYIYVVYSLRAMAPITAVIEIFYTNTPMYLPPVCRACIITYMMWMRCHSRREGQTNARTIRHTSHQQDWTKKHTKPTLQYIEELYREHSRAQLLFMTPAVRVSIN